MLHLIRSGRRVARAFSRADITNIVGCPVLAFYARAGMRLPISWG